MAWLDNYRQAKFRGISFFVPSSETAGGRRGAIFEFPKRDTPFIEDMGRKARKFSIDAIIVGDDYMQIRNDLIQALEKKGSGKLVHPYLGTLDVFCTDYSFRETSNEGRMVSFTISFAESGLLQFPNTIIDTTTNAALKKRNALQKAKLNYMNRMLDLKRARRPISTQWDLMFDTVEFGLTVLNDAKKTVSSVSSYQRDLTNLFDKLKSAIFDDDFLSDSFLNLMTFGTNEDDEAPADETNAKNQLDEMKLMFDFAPLQTITEDDPSLIFADFYQFNSVINALGLMTIIEYDSVDESQEIKQGIFAKLDEIMLSIDDDELYDSLYDLQTAVTQDLEIRVNELPRLTEYIPIISLPALVIAHELYGNIDEEQDLVDRNHVSNPNFVPGSQPIEVKIFA